MSVAQHRNTYPLLNEALAGAELPLLATEVMRAGFQNAVTAASSSR
jgi:hypothetical protein